MTHTTLQMMAESMGYLILVYALILIGFGLIGWFDMPEDDQ